MYSWTSIFAKVFALVIGTILVSLIFGLIFSGIIALLWGWIMVPVFNLPDLTWYQVWGISFITSYFFGGRTSASKSNE